MENDDLQPPSSTLENPNHHQKGSVSSVASISNSEKHSDQAQVTSAAQSSSTTRLYECSFCKKGFSNAQALGGHMNIHRKDKAKLKQAGQRKITNPLTPSNPSSLSAAVHEDHHHHLNHRLSYESHVALAEITQLPLFVDAAGVSQSHQELDLELRLGVHEPRPKPAVALGTRKFF